MKPVIELKHLTKTYGQARGVTDISLEVPAGSIFGFLGPNGAGKTTTISILIDFIRPTNGSARLFGLDSQANSREIHQRIGFLAGDMAMDNGLTGWQQLEYLGRLRGNFDKPYIKELARRLDCNLNRKFKKLSRGNRQKVGLIAALMHKPELLIFDEPTSGLDPLIQAEFNKIIMEHKAGGGTTFISSHVLSEVQEICDTVSFIRDGRLIATRPVEDITHQAPKQLMVSTTNRKLLAQLSEMPDLELSQETKTTIHGTYSGDVNALIKLLAGYKLDAFSLQEADLESAFIQYYEGGKSNA